MYVCICICMYVCIHVYKHIRPCIYEPTLSCVCIHIDLYILYMLSTPSASRHLGNNMPFFYRFIDFSDLRTDVDFDHPSQQKISSRPWVEPRYPAHPRTGSKQPLVSLVSD